LLKAAPDAVAIRNNHITLALLLGQIPAQAWQLAKKLHEEVPTHLAASSTYAFSLLQQGKAKEAVAIMEPFPADDLRDPLVALYYGSFLAAAGHVEQATPFLELAGKAHPLPEERRLLEVFSAFNRTRTFDQSGNVRAAVMAWNEALATAAVQPDLLELLARLA